MFGRDDYYKTLELDIDASALEIKKAYFAAIRKYPPERFPEEFKKLREAYDTLSNPKSRQEYDAIIKAADGAEKHFELGKDAYDNEDYETAVNELQAAFSLAPEVGFIRNLLGLSYMELEEYTKAANIFKKLTFDYPENFTYHTNLGHALLESGAHKKARNAFEAALKIDNTHFDAWSGLADCFMHMRDANGARKTLLEGIKYCGDNISFRLELVHIDIYRKNLKDMEANVAKLAELAENDPEMKGNVAWALAKTAIHLMKFNITEYAVKILEKANEIEPNERLIRDAYEMAAKTNILAESLNRLKLNKDIHPFLLEYLDLMIAEVSGALGPIEDLELRMHKQMILCQPEPFVSSISYLKANHPELYNLQKRDFNKILKKPSGIKVDRKKLTEDIKMHAMLTGVPLDFDAEFIDFDLSMPKTSTREEKIGRNDPCPCGSGKKYKKCCLR